jgi:hypothetical protein
MMRIAGSLCGSENGADEELLAAIESAGGDNGDEDTRFGSRHARTGLQEWG